MFKIIHKILIIYILVIYNKPALTWSHHILTMADDDLKTGYFNSTQDVFVKESFATYNTEQPPPVLQSILTVLPRCMPGYILVGIKCRKMV